VPYLFVNNMFTKAKRRTMQEDDGNQVSSETLHEARQESIKSRQYMATSNG
jgi:hypothetical protein